MSPVGIPTPRRLGISLQCAAYDRSPPFRLVWIMGCATMSGCRTSPKKEEERKSPGSGVVHSFAATQSCREG